MTERSGARFCYTVRSMVRELSFRPPLERGSEFCAHGNIAINCDTCNAKPSVLGIDRADISGSTKVYPNEQKARLLLKEIPGRSFDRMEKSERAYFLAQHANELIHETARALTALRDAGVHVVDINEGTFIFDEENGELVTRIVDLELGYDEQGDTQEGRDRALAFLTKNDFALRTAAEKGAPLPATTETITKSEMFRWAVAMGNILGSHYAQLDPRTRAFLNRCSHPDSAKRPSSFAELLSENSRAAA